MNRSPPSLPISSDLLGVFPYARTRRARKAHGCDSCGAPIDSGERYVDTGELKHWPRTYRYCSVCGKATDDERQERFRAWREKQRTSCSS